MKLARVLPLQHRDNLKALSRIELLPEAMPIARAESPAELMTDGGDAIRRRIVLIGQFVEEGIAYWSGLGMSCQRPGLAVYNDPDSVKVGMYWPHIQTMAVNMVAEESLTRPITLHELGHHIDSQFSGGLSIANAPLCEGKADFFSACVMFGRAKEEAIVHALSFFRGWREHAGYTLEHYDDLFYKLTHDRVGPRLAWRRGNGAGMTSGDPRAEIHELGFRLIVMYCLGKGMSLNELAVPVMTMRADRIHNELLDMIRNDTDNTLRQRIADHLELAVYRRLR